jgi:hypothetical protein
LNAANQAPHPVGAALLLTTPPRFLVRTDGLRPLKALHRSIPQRHLESELFVHEAVLSKPVDAKCGRLERRFRIAEPPLNRRPCRADFRVKISEPLRVHSERLVKLPVKVAQKTPELGVWLRLLLGHAAILGSCER